jgi:hypothetical protein
MNDRDATEACVSGPKFAPGTRRLGDDQARAWQLSCAAALRRFDARVPSIDGVERPAPIRAPNQRGWTGTPRCRWRRPDTMPVLDEVVDDRLPLPRQPRERLQVTEWAA